MATASYDEIYDWIRSLLGKTSVQLPDATLTPYVASAIASTLLMYPCIGADYDAIDADSSVKPSFDESIGLTVASRLVNTVPGMSVIVGASNVSKIKQGGVEITYGTTTSSSTSTGSSSGDVTSVWIGLAWEALQRITCVAESVEYVKTISVMGRRRALALKGYSPNIANPLYPLIVEDLAEAVLPPEE